MTSTLMVAKRPPAMIRAKPLDVAACLALVASERWASRVKPEGGCLVWVGAGDRNGYGRVKLGGPVRYVHRVAWVAVNGTDIPPGLTIDHLCRNRACVNPDHLEAVTHQENLLRGDTFQAANAAKTHCPRGHALVDGNLVASCARRGEKYCLTCHRKTARERDALLKAAREALGLTRREYIAKYGQSRAAAESVVALLTSKGIGT